jgi:DNA-binding NtrC family response regulator
VTPVELLLVDDDARFRAATAEVLGEAGHSVRLAASAAEADATLERDGLPAVVVLDLGLPGEDGLSFLGRIRKRWPDLPVIVITGHGTIATAIQAMRLGALHYLTKPYDLSELELYLAKAAERGSLVRERQKLEVAQRLEGARELVGVSPEIERVRELVKRAKDEDVPVLVTGESGTGKELVARALHFDGNRQSGPFVAVNCAVLGGELLQAELFGHAPGAYTGARGAREGLFEVADRGTLFIDEVASMADDLQAALLRVLETKSFRRLGEARERTANVRVVAATNRPLEELVRKGAFREDLFFRLNVFPIEVPPLRARAGDVPLLVKHILSASPVAQRRGARVEQDAIDELARAPWPGNVRELRNVLERALLLADDGVVRAELVRDLLVRGRPAGVEPARESEFLSLRELEHRQIEKALARTQGNVSRAAQLLGIDRRTLQRKMAELKGEPPSATGDDEA